MDGTEGYDIRDFTENELLQIVLQIVSKPEALRDRDFADLTQINEEIKRRGKQS